MFSERTKNCHRAAGGYKRSCVPKDVTNKDNAASTSAHADVRILDVVENPEPVENIILRTIAHAGGAKDAESRVMRLEHSAAKTVRKSPVILELVRERGMGIIVRSHVLITATEGIAGSNAFVSTSTQAPVDSVNVSVNLKPDSGLTEDWPFVGGAWMKIIWP